MTFSFPRILFSLFPQGIKLEEQKPGPQKNKVGCVDEVAARWARQGTAGVLGSAVFHLPFTKSSLSGCARPCSRVHSGQ